MADARRATSASFFPTHTTRALEYTRSSGARPAATAASLTRPNCFSLSSIDAKGMLNSSAYLAASRGVRTAPWPPIRTGTFAWAGFGSAGESVSR